MAVVNYPARPPCTTACLGKPLEEIPDHLGAVDVVVLWPEYVGDHAGKAGVRDAARHAVAAVIDAVEHDVTSRRATRSDSRHRALIRRIAVVQVGRVGVLGRA